jgi:hypothetical protein
MVYLYNCRHSGDEYRITKFDEDINPIEGSSYLCTVTECTCPAGERPMCRHREMLIRFIEKKHIGDEWMFDYDRGGWVQCDLPREEVVHTPMNGTPITMPPTRR